MNQLREVYIYAHIIYIILLYRRCSHRERSLYIGYIGGDCNIRALAIILYILQ